MLSRAIQTADIALDAADRLWIPVKRSWRLNERHYGALQGKDKAQTLAEFGQEQFMLWRRSFDVPPPPLADDDEYSQVGDPRYVGIDGDIPRTESLKLVIDRLLPYWDSDIAPDLRAGKTVLVTAHGNSLRGLVKHLEGISDADISELNIPTGIPLVYRLDENLEPLGPGEYLDPEAAAAGAAAVAAQGKKSYTQHPELEHRREPRVGVLEVEPADLLHPAQPVAERVRVHELRSGCRGDVAERLEPCLQREARAARRGARRRRSAARSAPWVPRRDWLRGRGARARGIRAARRPPGPRGDRGACASEPGVGAEPHWVWRSTRRMRSTAARDCAMPPMSDAAGPTATTAGIRVPTRSRKSWAITAARSSATSGSAAAAKMP